MVYMECLCAFSSSAAFPSLGICRGTFIFPSSPCCSLPSSLAYPGGLYQVPAWHGAAEGCGLHLSLSKQHIVLQQQSQGPVVQVPLVVTLDFS